MVFAQWGHLVQCFYIHNLFPFWKHLHYLVIIINASIIVVIIGVPIIESNSTIVDDQKVGGDNLSFLKVLFMLNTDMCFFSGILLARLVMVPSVMLDISRDCIKLKFET